MRKTIGHVCTGVGAKNWTKQPAPLSRMASLRRIDDRRSRLQPPQLDQYDFTGS